MFFFPAWPYSYQNMLIISSVFSVQGLITEERTNIDPDARPFARRKNELGHQGLSEGASLVEVVRA